MTELNAIVGVRNIRLSENQLNWMSKSFYAFKAHETYKNGALQA